MLANEICQVIESKGILQYTNKSGENLETEDESYTYAIGDDFLVTATIVVSDGAVAFHLALDLDADEFPESFESFLSDMEQFKQLLLAIQPLNPEVSIDDGYTYSVEKEINSPEDVDQFLSGIQKVFNMLVKFFYTDDESSN